MFQQTRLIGSGLDDRNGVDDLEKILTYRIARLHQMLSVQATAILAPFDITLSNWRVLSAIWVEQVETSRQLAEKTGFDPAQISRALHSMEKAGLLRLSNNENDRRILMIEITEGGRDVLEAMLPHMKARYQALLNALEPDEIEIFLRIFDKLDAVAELEREEVLARGGL
jgi:DNA-binding MarR family transcriptional regulator